jgi:hypothetical protein
MSHLSGMMASMAALSAKDAPGAKGASDGSMPCCMALKRVQSGAMSNSDLNEPDKRGKTLLQYGAGPNPAPALPCSAHTTRA